MPNGDREVVRVSLLSREKWDGRETEQESARPQKWILVRKGEQWKRDYSLFTTPICMLTTVILEVKYGLLTYYVRQVYVSLHRILGRVRLKAM